MDDLVLAALSAAYAEGKISVQEFERRVDLHLHQCEVHALVKRESEILGRPVLLPPGWELRAVDRR